MAEDEQKRWTKQEQIKEDEAQMKEKCSNS